MLHETRLHMAEEHLRKAVDVAQTGGISLSEMIELMTVLYEEES